MGSIPSAAHRHGFRLLHFPSGIWQYRIGKKSVVIFSPTGERYCPDHSELTGLSWDAIERAHYKHTSLANIHPSTVREWIEKQFVH